MVRLRVQNLRSLADTGLLDLRPITLLVGRNSSGKSTFARTLPLLRQSTEVRSRDPVVWFGDLVDFGSFDDACRKEAREHLVTFTVSASADDVPLGMRPMHYPRRFRKPLGVDVTYSVTLKRGEDGETVAEKFELTVGRDVISASLKSRRLYDLIVLGHRMDELIGDDRFAVSSNTIVPTVDERYTESRWGAGSSVIGTWQDSAFEKVFDFFRKRLHGNFQNKSIRSMVFRLGYLPSSDEFMKRLSQVGQTHSSWNSIVRDLSKENRGYLRALYMMSLVPQLLQETQVGLGELLRNVAYVGPARATGQRYYRRTPLSVDSIAPGGENMAAYVGSLDSNSQKDLNLWMQRLIGQEVLTGTKTEGHVSLSLRDPNLDRTDNIADVGFGYSQLLPIMVQLWHLNRRSSDRRFGGRPTSIFVSEQPELHLHPALQARIAEAFVQAANESDGQRTFIVETHSQQIVNRVGALVAAGKFSPDAVAVYLFEQDDIGVSTVTQATFKPDGSLENWPYGFFSSGP